MIEPSAPIESILTAVAVKQAASETMQALLQRASEFANPLAARLTGIALDPPVRKLADQLLDDYWADPARRQNLLTTGSADREVIIGSGFHAAVYACVRVLSGYPKPLVVERQPRAGGTFAMTAQPTFYLNSRNRAGNAGLAGDQRANLNFLPGAPIQAANISMAEYQTNTDMALIIRLALAQFADVVTDTEVLAVSPAASGVEIALPQRPAVPAGRVIDARGLGDPTDQSVANGTTILTFGQFMQRMATAWPLRGVHRVAVLGGGDSAKCAVESCLGIAPQPPVAAAALDSIDQIDWYATDLPDTCGQWQSTMRGRYQAIGRYLRPDRSGIRRLSVLTRRPRPIALPGSALIDGRTYDLAILCTGNQETSLPGLDATSFDEYRQPGTPVVARKHYELPAFRVGPHARLPFTSEELEDGIADIPGNAVSMFRTAPKTAALAATLGPLPQN